MDGIDDAIASSVLFGLFAAAIVVENVILGTIRHAFVLATWAWRTLTRHRLAVNTLQATMA